MAFPMLLRTDTFHR